MNEVPIWESLEQVNKLFSSEGEYDAMIQNLETTCLSLSEIAANGSDDEKRRAQAALLAYGRSLELIREIGEKAAKE